MRLSLEELANSLDELFMEVADIREQNEAMGQMLAERDKMTLVMAKHVERLTREKEVLLMHLGLQYLQSKK